MAVPGGPGGVGRSGGVDGPAGIDHTRYPHRRPVPLAATLLALLAGDGSLTVPAGPTGGVADVVDIGGGSGTLALALAVAGHRVRVVDPSPDAIAALTRRAAEAGLGELATGLVGDLWTVAADPGFTGGADLLCLHDVLENLPDPAAALTAVRPLLRPRGVLSVLVPQRSAAVLARALAGRPAQARTARHSADGRWGAGDPVRRRFDRGELLAMLDRAGFEVQLFRGERTVADLVPGSLRDVDFATRRAYSELDAELATDPAFVPVAARLHVVAAAT